MKFYSLNQFSLCTDEIFFRYLDDIHSNDAIVIFNPADAMVVAPVLLRSRKTLEEHISYVQKNKVKKAIIIAEDIGFLKQCPSLEYLWIIPALAAEDFDYSPIYELPNIKWLQCETMYGIRAMYDVEEKVKVANIDYRRLTGVKRLVISGAKGHQNVSAAENVVSLQFNSGFPASKTLSSFTPKADLSYFSVCQAPIQSLEGIEDLHSVRRLELLYNRRLSDISALRHLRDSLAYLEINTCGRICDFSVLSELTNLEFLTLKGSNTLNNLSFLKELPKLKNLQITMNVKDGDLSLCEMVPYVRIKNHKHYSHKNTELPKNFTDPDSFYPADLL